jgi:hypothetical protein
VLGSEESKVMENGLLECAAWDISRILGFNFEFQVALLQNFDVGIARKRETLLMSVNIFCTVD